jgi:hypothetical protein
MDLPERSEFDRSERLSDGVRLSQEERAGTGRLGLSITHRNLSSPGTYRSLAERQTCVPSMHVPVVRWIFDAFGQSMASWELGPCDAQRTPKRVKVRHRRRNN